MNKTLITIIMVIAGISILTNFVSATGNIAATTTVASCPACSSGSPDMESYIKWLTTMLDVVDSAPNVDPGAIYGQWINFERKRQESNERATYSSQRGTLSITKQSRGIKSDMTALNKLHDRITQTANTLINTKSQWSKPISSELLALLQSKVAIQVGSNKLLNWQWDWSNIISYKDTIHSILMLHQQVVSLTQWTSGAIITRQWYKSNPATINKFEKYYACAQTIPACSSQTKLLEDRSISVRWYWAEIMRAGREVSSVFSAQYRKTPKRNGSIFQFGDGIESAWKMILTEWAIWWWRKEFAKSLKTKRENKQKQKELTQKQEETIQQSQEAIKNSISNPKAVPTQTLTVWSSNMQAYKQQDISYFQTVTNQINDQLLANNLQMQEAIIAMDPTLITHQIPKLTEQIYKAWQSIAVTTNKLYDACQEHCSNLWWICGKPVPNS